MVEQCQYLMRRWYSFQTVFACGIPGQAWKGAAHPAAAGVLGRLCLSVSWYQRSKRFEVRRAVRLLPCRIPCYENDLETFASVVAAQM